MIRFLNEEINSRIKYVIDDLILFCGYTYDGAIDLIQKKDLYLFLMEGGEDVESKTTHDLMEYLFY